MDFDFTQLGSQNRHCGPIVLDLNVAKHIISAKRFPRSSSCVHPSFALLCHCTRSVKYWGHSFSIVKLTILGGIDVVLAPKN